MSRSNLELSGLSFLVVESESMLRELWIGMLENLGAQVRTAEGVQKFLDSVETYSVDCLLCNVSLMDGDGYTMMKSLRQLDTHCCSQIPAIAVFDSWRAANHQCALESGFQAVITHPLQIQEVIDTVLRVVSKNRFSCGADKLK